MRRPLLALLPLLLLLPAAACGGNVVVDTDAVITGNGGATTSTATTTGTTTGTGTTTDTTTSTATSTSTTTTTTTTTTTSTTGTGGGPACVGIMSIVVDGAGSSTAFQSGCAMSGEPPPPPEPVGEVLTSASPTTYIDACASTTLGAEGVFIAFAGEGPGAYAPIKGFYTPPGGGLLWGAPGPFMLNIDAFGPVGGAISGSFSMPVVDQAQKPHQIEGKFVVCRLPDNFAP